MDGSEDIRQRVQSLRRTILRSKPESQLQPVKAEILATLQREYPTIPEHLLIFFEDFGAGCIGDSNYSIYPLIDPDDVYDEVTAAELKGIVLIGDDFAGTVDGYDTNEAGWRFGLIGSSGKFEPAENRTSIIDLLEEWYAKPE